MKQFLMVISVLILITGSVNAQSDVTVKKSEFKTIDDGFKVAWKHIDEGDKFYSEGGIFFAKALEEYIMANSYNNANPELNYKIGASMLFSDRKEKAAPYLLKALELKNDVAADALLLAGLALMYSGEFDTATEKLNVYLDSEHRKSEENILKARKIIDECASAKEITGDTLGIMIENLGSAVNSDADDYSEVFSSDGLKIYFASRKGLQPGSRNFYPDTKFDENIYVSEFAGGNWSVPLLAGPKITSKLCETPLFISRSGEVLYIYTGYKGNGDLQVSEMKKGAWGPPSPESFGINSSYSETSFCISPGGDEIAFVSDRPKKGQGGKDIYIIKKLNSRKWSKPENIGPAVNTPYDEESVSYSFSGDTLWFSSTGHNTMGGFDIFFSVKDSSGTWGEAINAGYPLNTVWDELFYRHSPVDDSLFYFVSDRPGSYGGLDIFAGRILPPPPPPSAPEEPPLIPSKDTIVVRDTIVVVKEIPKEPVAVQSRPSTVIFTGKISDSESGEPVPARIEITDVNIDAIVGTAASSVDDGIFRTELPGRKVYIVDIKSAGYLPVTKKISISESFEGEAFNLDFTMDKVTVGKKVVLNNILFELGKAVLTPDSFEELDRLVTILQDNPLMKIEISGHTDNTGSPVVNARLSTERARAVVDYLVSKGIDKSRLTYRGYGSEQPIAGNETEAGRAINRRVEFKILEF